MSWARVNRTATLRPEATVWPGSIWRSMTTPSMGATMVVRDRLAWFERRDACCWATWAWPARTRARAVVRLAEAVSSAAWAMMSRSKRYFWRSYSAWARATWAWAWATDAWAAWTDAWDCSTADCWVWGS